jgi:hypothetical protein
MPSAVPASDLQQVETRGTVVDDSTDGARSERPRRRRRPTTTAPTSEPALQQVETVLSAAPLPTTAETTSPTPHPTRRRQRPQTVVVNEPLVQVETGQPPQ